MKNIKKLLIYLILIIIGYSIAELFSKYSCNGFSIGGKTIPPSCSNILNRFCSAKKKKK